MPCPAWAGGAAGAAGGRAAARPAEGAGRASARSGLGEGTTESEDGRRKLRGKKPRSLLLFPEMDSPCWRDAPAKAPPRWERTNQRRGGWNYEWAGTHVTRRRLKGPRHRGDPAATPGGQRGDNGDTSGPRARPAGWKQPRSGCCSLPNPQPPFPPTLPLPSPSRATKDIYQTTEKFLN